MMHNRFNKTTLVLLIVAAAMVVYFPLRENGFINCDDPQYVTENSYVGDGLTLEGLKWAFNTNYFFNYHPLTWLAHMSDTQIFGVNPAGHHLTSLILHIVNTLLLLVFLERLTIPPLQALFIAALFTLHPLNVESVAWVSEKKNLLYTTFWFPSLIAYLKYGKTLKKNYYFLCFTFFVLSLLSKPMAVTLPVVLFLLDFWPLRRFSKLSIAEKIPFIIPAFLSSLITYNLHAEGSAIATLSVFPLTSRIGYSMVSYVNYILKMICPVNLILFYPYPEGFITLKFIFSALFLIVITFLAFKLRKTHPYFLFGWAWFLIVLFPVSRVFFAGRDPMSDRHAYLSAIGIFIIAAAGLPDLLKHKSLDKYKESAFLKTNGQNTAAVLPVFISVAILSVFSIISLRQVQRWRDSLTLFSYAVTVSPRSFQSYNNYGAELIAHGRYSEAINLLQKGLEINPSSPSLNYKMGYALTKLGRIDEAYDYYSKTKFSSSQISEAFYYKREGLRYLKDKKYLQAVRYLSLSLEITPGDVEAINNKGIALMGLGRLVEAAEMFTAGLTINPKSPEMLYNKALALKQNGNTAGALECLAAALKLAPESKVIRKAIEDISSQR
ncbi:MAG: tetratricopeptide repeat protein [Nitrospirae bacterium YQR-1]